MEKLIAALARCRNVPFDREVLRGMDRDQLDTVARGALKALPADSAAFEEIMSARVAATEERVSALSGFARDHGGASGGEEEINVRVRNVLSGPRGSAVLDRPEERERFEGRNRDGDGVDVDVRNILSGRRGTGVLDD